MEEANLVKTYLEIGMLGLCCILVIVIFWLSYKRGAKSADKIQDRSFKKEDSTDAKIDKLITMIYNQNQEYKEAQDKRLEEERARNEQLIESIIHGVTSHTPSPEENQKLTEVSDKIDSVLQKILITTKADRVHLVQYHNGGRGINKQSFLKMSITNEQVQLGIKPFMPEFKDQFRSVLSYFVRKLAEEGYCYISNVDDIAVEDTGLYEFMRYRSLESKFGVSICGVEGNVIAFVSLEYLDKSKVDVTIIDKCLKEYKNTIETLLSL